jgi:hypothetical protein
MRATPCSPADDQQPVSRTSDACLPVGKRHEPVELWAAGDSFKGLGPQADLLQATVCARVYAERRKNPRMNEASVTQRPSILCLLGILALPGCTPDAPVTAAPAVPVFIAAEIETGPDGLCYGRDISPAVLETVTAQVLDAPAVLAPDGAVVTPAIYRSVIRQEIVRERQEVAFETVCPPAYTLAFVETLQRALAVRGFYNGPLTGVMDIATGQAVQAFQRQTGPDSPLLSIATARALGIVALTADQIDALSD